jgi:hypothetical protein
MGVCGYKIGVRDNQLCGLIDANVIALLVSVSRKSLNKTVALVIIRSVI